jgi:hypothetical protein
MARVGDDRHVDDRPRRLVGVALGLLLLAGVIAAVVISLGGGGPSTTAVRGLIGSEKEAFFADPRVVRALADRGLVVHVEKAGSREIATRYDLSQYDFAFPAGVPAAEKIRQDRKVTTTYAPFFTPMAIATWQPIVDLLAAAGIVRQDGGLTLFDMAAFMDLVERNARWSDLPDNPTFPVNKSVLVTSTDVRKSNSAAMYLALASYVANERNIVSSDAQIDAVLPVVEPLFLRQGFVENSSEAPFDDYLVQGMGKAPMVMIYEAQYIEQAARASGVRPEMVLMYPDPTILSKHTLVPLSDGGRKLGEALTTDPTLQRLAIESGFRAADAAAFDAFVADQGLDIPSQLVSVIDPPTYEVLERMIGRIEQAYGGPAAQDDDITPSLVPLADPSLLVTP